MNESSQGASRRGESSPGAAETGDAATTAGAPEPDVRYEWYSHEQLKAIADGGNDPESAGEIGTGWRSLGRTLQQASEQLAGTATDSEDVWQGEAGRALRAALGRATAWAGQAAATADALGGAVSAQAGAAAHARSAMPDPVSYDPGAMIRDAMGTGDLAALAGLTDAMAQRRAESEEARRRAVDVLHARDLALRDAARVSSFPVPPSLSGPA
ncbi:PE-PGRS family protein [Prauserella alba]|uniref:PPE domain-containing protein n=1 Tax=Prauserella alba TaxID=176898 RepID=A0ABN1VT74_9PSEU|nr:PE-PGRS family protein [Prauserella alba]MCP2179845.1 PPE family protein [Prauserella alba]